MLESATWVVSITAHYLVVKLAIKARAILILRYHDAINILCLTARGRRMIYHVDFIVFYWSAK